MNADDIKRLKIGLSLLGVALVLIFIARVINYRYITTGTITTTNWELKIDQLQYQTIAESNWSIPDGGRLDHKVWEYHYSYRYKSGSHWETKSGGTYNCGTAKKPKTCKNPDKRVEVDEYSTREVYDWKYYYYIDRWINISPLITHGTDKEDIHWPNIEDHTYSDTNVIGNIKLGAYSSYYWLVIIAEGKTYTFDMNDAEWKKYGNGEHIKLTLGYFNNIISIDKEK